MFSLFKKKSELEKLIDKEGLNEVAMGFACVISGKLQNYEIAYQYVLEELEAASMGNAEAMAYVRSCGIPASEYKGSLNNSRPEVDGPSGPQQTMIALCLELQANKDLMVRFRIKVLENIMREHEFGKYANDVDDNANDHYENTALESDVSIAKISVPPSSQPKRSHFYLMGLSGEGLAAPVHIHFDSFEPAFKFDQNAYLKLGKPSDGYGTFLVTISSPNFHPKGHTCRVSGVNYKLTRRGVVDSVIAHVEMVRDVDEEPIERVRVTLREDGSIIGLRETEMGYEEADLNDVWFSYGDTVFLNGDGCPFDEMNKPQPTQRQKLFMQDEENRRNCDFFGS